MMNRFQASRNHPARRARRGVGVLLVAALCVVGSFLTPAQVPRASSFNQDLAKLRRFVQSGGDSPAMLVFRQGRTAIEREDWEGAAAKFDSYIAGYPKERDVDAALYWLAYALKKQRKFQAADERLERLLREFPRSTWADDARAMQAEIAPQTGKRVELEGIADDELKMVALQSLFQSDPQRAAVYAREILKMDSRASRELKETAVNLLGQRQDADSFSLLSDIARTQPDPELRAAAIHRLGQFRSEAALDELLKIYDAERDTEVKERVLHSLSQNQNPRAYSKLLDIARGGDNTELRQMAIHWIGQRRDAQSFDDLMRILNTDRDEEIRARILHSLSQMPDPRAEAKLLEVARSSSDSLQVRAQAIHWLGQKRREGIVEELMTIFRADRNEEIRGAVLHALSQNRSGRARELLLDIARSSGDDTHSRTQAIHWLGQRGDAESLELLIKLYDAEREDEVKQSLLHAFSQSKQERALQKLMDVARGDASRELRKTAIHWLGQSRDPRALKFLQDLLR
ncbi:MAG TPA: HEAT repeat domain-containing protein [Pyrinomonadaceae bacterium]|nr:HEAT repeat domain-containing protein [Pyrinomonadaceae bacterium]